MPSPIKRHLLMIKFTIGWSHVWCKELGSIDYIVAHYNRHVFYWGSFAHALGSFTTYCMTIKSFMEILEIFFTTQLCFDRSIKLAHMAVEVVLILLFLLKELWTLEMHFLRCWRSMAQKKVGEFALNHTLIFSCLGSSFVDVSVIINVQ